MSQQSPSDSSESAKLDLDQLKSLDFGPDWSGGSSSKPTASKPDREKSPRRSGPARDRRPAKKRTGFSPRRREENFEPVVQFSIFPEDEPFDLLTQSIRSSLKVYELFEVTRLILDKADRMVVVVAPLKDDAPPLYECLTDRQLFREEAKALRHAAVQALPVHFTEQEEEVEPPKGNFSSVLRCGITGRYLPPKNYHRFQAFLAEHHRLHCAEKSINQVEKSLQPVNDPSAVEEWLDTMKKRTVYRLRLAPQEPSESSPLEPENAGESVDASEAQTAGSPPVENTAPEDAAGEGSATEAGSRIFETREDAIQYLLMNHREGLVRETRQARVPGKALLDAEDDSIRKSFEVYLEKQKKFPLDTANNVRMKLRKAKFFLFKKGKKGISYVSAVRRKNREPDAVFSDSTQEIMQKIEAKPGLKVRDLPALLHPERPLEEGKSPLSDDERRKLLNDLKWLKLEGYLYEFSDGTLELQDQAPSQEEKASSAESGVKGLEESGQSAQSERDQTVQDS